MNINDKIAEVAYSIYEQNGKVDGWDFDNWLAAEKIVMSQDVLAKDGSDKTALRNQGRNTGEKMKTKRVKANVRDV